MRKLEVKFDKPIYMDMCIFDISKTCLYKFHYKYMAPLFREKCKVMNCYVRRTHATFFFHKDLEFLETLKFYILSFFIFHLKN